MKIHELISKLQEYDQNLDVVLFDLNGSDIGYDLKSFEVDTMLKSKNAYFRASVTVSKFEGVTEVKCLILE